MTEDPRWQRALAHLADAAAADKRGDSAGLGRGVEALCDTLDSLALDPAVPRRERRRAAKLLDSMKVQVRARLPDLLRRVAELRDTATDANQRAEWDAVLTRHTAQEPAASNARH
jgi:hypothetical protein